jgi:hypothetical protein
MMTTSDILEHMKQGAELHREFGEIELRMPDGGKFLIPTGMFDALIDERRIVAGSGGFYRLS